MKELINFVTLSLPESIVIAFLMRTLFGRQKDVSLIKVILTGVTNAIFMEILRITFNNDLTAVALSQMACFLVVYYIMYDLKTIESVVGTLSIFTGLIIIQYIGNIILRLIIGKELYDAYLISRIQGYILLGFEISILLIAEFIFSMTKISIKLQFGSKHMKKITKEMKKFIGINLGIFVIIFTMNYKLLIQFADNNTIIVNIFTMGLCLFILIASGISLLDTMCRKKFNNLVRMLSIEEIEASEKEV